MHMSTFMTPFLDQGQHIIHALGLIRYVVDTLETLSFVEPESTHPTSGSYNPPKNGCAYYFMGHGEKLRDACRFTIDKETSDGPTTHSCSKNFSKPVMSI